MFFDSVVEIEKIAVRSGTSVFVVPDNIDVNIKNAIILQPEEKTTITIEQVRSTTSQLNTKQSYDSFIIIRPAEKLGVAASNAFLKNLEEPGDKIHYVLITSQPSKLLATILSRANVYFLRTNFDITKISSEDKAKKALAKDLIAARPSDLIRIAQEITKKKQGVRDYALDIIGIAIEMLYKAYFQNQKDVFLKKLPKFLSAYENIAKNGNIKLQLVANLC